MMYRASVRDKQDAWCKADHHVGFAGWYGRRSGWYEFSIFYPQGYYILTLLSNHC
jgi:hypothetical protein